MTAMMPPAWPSTLDELRERTEIPVRDRLDAWARIDRQRLDRIYFRALAQAAKKAKR